MEYLAFRKRRARMPLPALHTEITEIFCNWCSRAGSCPLRRNGSSKFGIQSDADATCKYLIFSKDDDFVNLNLELFPECLQLHNVPAVCNNFNFAAVSSYQGSPSSVFVLWHSILYCLHLLYINANSGKYISRRHERGEFM